MSIRLNPYLSFDGNARAAMEFYREVFGGELAINTFAEFGNAGADNADNVMHSQLDAAHGFVLMAADMAPDGGSAPTNSAVSLSGDDADDLRGYWQKLSEGGQVQVPMEKQMWGDEFGMCTDKFNVPWMVNVTAATT